MQIFFFIVILFYVFLIVDYYLGWKKINIVNHTQYTPKVSLIISLRNEEERVIELLSNLNNLTYPKNKLEILLVNDHSTDNTLSLLKKNKNNKIKVLNLVENIKGKKQAIMYAINHSTGDIIVTTDADCSFQSYWIEEITKYFIDEDIKLVSGPVRYKREKTIFSQLQALEFYSLIISGAGAIGNNRAIFCNGANLAYRKETFLQFNGYSNDIVSGDDVFFLHFVKKKFPKGIFFAKNNKLIVDTKAVLSFSHFINQRKRWTSKSIYYKDFSTIYSSLIVFITNLSIVFYFFLSINNFFPFDIFCLVFILKCLVDFLLLIPILSFFQRKHLIKWIIPFEFFYSFYIVLIVLLSLSSTFEWKERLYKK